MSRLSQLTADSRVNGIVISVETDASVAAAFSAWEAQVTSTELANAVTEAIRQMIMNRLQIHPNTEYLVLVGDDRVLPYRRVSDRTRYPESNYLYANPITTTVGAALKANMTLTDNFYADREFTTWVNGDLYIPDLAVGRLVETPEQIIAQIEYFLGHLQPRVANRATVAGYDFIQDTALSICNQLRPNVITADCALIGDTWGSNDLRAHMLGVPNDLVSLNTHANHFSFVAPLGGVLTSAEVMSSTVALSGTLIYHMADHAGLNMPSESTLPLDWPEVFAAKQAVYVGSTGFAWGSSAGIGWAEQMMTLLTQYLLEGSTQAVGNALKQAKRAYYEEKATVFDAYDEKTLLEFTLYGLPMYAIQTPTTGLGSAIVVGGHNEDYTLQTNINYCTNRAYRTLLDVGFDDSSIYYLSPSDQDPDGDGNSEVDAPATVSNLGAAIETWAAMRAGPGKPLHLYFMDHGMTEAFCIDGCAGGGQMTPAMLDGWLSGLEASTGIDEINLVIEAVRSGSFIDRVGAVTQSVSKAGRVVITSTDRDHNAYASAQGAYFSDAFIACIAAGNNLMACYEQATAAVANVGAVQNPWLDDNGDGVFSASDGLVAQYRYVGHSAQTPAPTPTPTATSMHREYLPLIIRA